MEHVRTITREFATGGRAVLHVESRSGSVLVEGRESDRVVIDAVVRVSTDLSIEADEAAKLVEQAMEQDAHRVIVRAPSLPKRDGWGALFGRGSSVEYRIRVPVKTAVRVLSRSGTVQITHVEGVVHTEAASGKVGIDDVRGNVTAVSRSGGLLIERVIGDVKAEARSGKVSVHHVKGEASIDSRSGTADAADIDGDLRIVARSGSVSIENARGKVHLRAKAGSARYRGRVLGDFDWEALAGSIHLAVDPDYPFFIDAESQAGSVRSDLPPRRKGGDPKGGGPRVRLRSRAGSIRLSRLD